jgi:orotate phosphoribosyltransferase
LSLSYPEIRDTIRDGLVKSIRENFFTVESIAGVATAGIPQGVLVAQELNLPFIYVRPKPKEHGMGNLIEGKVFKNQKVVLIEDLVSTGGSSLKAAQALRDEGMQVIGMVSVFSYGFDIATKNFYDANVSLISLSDYSHLLRVAVEQKYVSDDQLISLKSWSIDPANWNK